MNQTVDGYLFKAKFICLRYYWSECFWSSPTAHQTHIQKEAVTTEKEKQGTTYTLKWKIFIAIKKK